MTTFASSLEVGEVEEFDLNAFHEAFHGTAGGEWLCAYPIPSEDRCSLCHCLTSVIRSTGYHSCENKGTWNNYARAGRVKGVPVSSLVKWAQVSLPMSGARPERHLTLINGGAA